MSKIDDVARMAKVSKGTVSNVFSQKRPISEAVRKRVLKAAQELKYTPNQVARSLVTKKTMTISLNIPYTKNLSLSTFHTNLMNGVITEAALHNYRILIDTLSQEQLELPFISRDAVDGVIILDPRNKDSRIHHLTHFGIPFVVIGQPPDTFIEDVSYVDNNNAEIVKQITTFLIKQGHKRIIYLNAPLAMTVSQVRTEGFYQAYHSAQISPDYSRVIYKATLKEEPREFGYKSIMEVFNEKKKYRTQPLLPIQIESRSVRCGRKGIKLARS